MKENQVEWLFPINCTLSYFFDCKFETSDQKISAHTQKILPSKRIIHFSLPRMIDKIFVEHTGLDIH